MNSRSKSGNLTAKALEANAKAVTGDGKAGQASETVRLTLTGLVKDVDALKKFVKGSSSPPTGTPSWTKGTSP